MSWSCHIASNMDHRFVLACGQKHKHRCEIPCWLNNVAWWACTFCVAVHSISSWKGSLSLSRTLWYDSLMIWWNTLRISFFLLSDYTILLSMSCIRTNAATLILCSITKQVCRLCAILDSSSQPWATFLVIHLLLLLITLIGWLHSPTYWSNSLMFINIS